MMERDRILVPSLAGGVSRQPAHNRFPDQVEEAINVRFSVEDGASKRPGSEYVCDIDFTTGSKFNGDSDPRIHVIERDADEQYICIYGPNVAGNSFVLSVYSVDGTEATINGYSGDVETYLETDIANASADDYKFVTVADTTLIVNTRAAVGMETSTAYSTSYNVRDHDAILSLTPDNDEYVYAEQDGDSEPAGYWRYTPEDDLEYAKITFQLLTGDWAAPRGNWDDAGASEMPGGFRISQSRQLLTGFTAATWTAATRTVTKTGAFASYTFRPGDMICMTAGTDFVAGGWYLIESKTSDNAIVLAVATKQRNAMAAGDQVDLAANSADGARIGSEAEVVVDFNADPQSDMFDIAAGIQTHLRNAGWENGLVAWIPKGSGGYFEITSSFRGSGARVYTPSAPTTGADLTNDATDPFYATNAVTVAGTGSLGTKEPTQPSSWRWTRVAAPGQSTATFSPEKMPVKLTRTSLSPLEFDLAVCAWQDRLTGDASTNPAPKPFHNSATTNAYIKDACYFEGRLFLAVGEYAIFSEADNLFNFFLVDASQVVDSDRISKAIGTNKIANIRYAVPYRRSLLLLTDSGQQYQIGYGEALTPANVSINSTSQFRTSMVRPIVVGPYIYFVTEKDNGSAIWEYFYDEASGSYLATEITKHCSGYVPLSLRSLVGDSVQEALACGPVDDRDLYVYRTHWRGNDKALSSWSRYRFDSTYDIQDVGFLGGNMYMLVYISGEWMLEKLPLSEPETPTDFDYMPHLDRVRLIPDADMSYDAGNDWTVIDLDTTKASSSTYNAYLLQDGTYVCANDADQMSGPSTLWNYGTGDGLSNDTDMSVPGDVTGDDLYLGRYYLTELTLTRPFRRDDRGRANTGESLRVQTMWVTHHDSGKYRVSRDNESANWSDANTDFTPTAVTEDGYLRVPCRHDADAETVKITDALQNANGASVATPLNISAVEYEVEAVPGARRN